jgi:hypothetical protein
MLKITVEGVLLFLLPFVAYGGLLALGPRVPWLRAGPGGITALRLAACGVGLVILALVLWATLGERARGTYVPAHIDGGRLIPGRME